MVFSRFRRSGSAHRLRCPDIELVHSDVLDFPIPEDVTHAFFFNPFQGETFGTVIARLVDSLDRKPRRLRLLYLHPVEDGRIMATGRFRRLTPAVDGADGPTGAVKGYHVYEALPVN